MIYRDISPELAGIYIFKNNINGKCYVGQSISIRKRIKGHMNALRKGSLDLPLYRALNKYGIHNFTIDILYSFVPDKDIDQLELIKRLDELEIKYIEEYNAYTEGYNCTKGGDFGVLGLRMTENQKKNCSDAVKQRVSEGDMVKHVYMYHVIEKYYIYAWSLTDAGNITGLSRSNIGRLCNNTYYRPTCSAFIAAYTEEELKEKIQNLTPEVLNSVNINGRATGPNNTKWYKGMISPNKGKKLSEEQKIKIRQTSNKYVIYQYSKSGELINTFNSVKEAASVVQCDPSSIRAACICKLKSCKGFVWKRELKHTTHLKC